MIQRIQSLYLLLVILLSFIVLYVSLNSPLGIELNSFFKDTDSFFGPLLHAIEEHCLDYIHEIVSIQNCFLHNAWININFT